MEPLPYRLRKRAEIRRQITTRRSVQNGEPDRISDLLEEAAGVIEDLVDAVQRGSYLYDGDLGYVCIECDVCAGENHLKTCAFVALLRRVEG